ncbi:MAG: VOC family protein [Chloroflexota bacterium]
MANQPVFKVDKLAHVCLVVEDIDKMVEAYWRDFGIGPWRIVTMDSATMKEATYRGKPAQFRMRFALTDVGGFTLEMVQHLGGQTIYKDFQDKVGEGVHHLGLVVDNLGEAVAKMEAAGFKPIMTAVGYGKSRDGEFAYMGTEDELGTIYELVKLPTEKIDPDKFYPAQ